MKPKYTLEELRGAKLLGISPWTLRRDEKRRRLAKHVCRVITEDGKVLLSPTDLKRYSDREENP